MANAKGTPRAGQPRKSATTSAPQASAKPKRLPKPGTQARLRAGAKPGGEASQRIDEQLRSLAGWRGETLAKVRRLIHEADPDIVEEVKWIKPTNPSGVPVWSHAGIVCTGEAYKQVVKLTFARGASLDDPQGLFNASLEGNTRRAIDIREGEILDAKALKALIKAAVAVNLRRERPESKGTKSQSAPKAGEQAKPRVHAQRAARAKPTKAGKKEKVVLLSGGNPQIAKGEGDAPVQAYIAAMPGWKHDLGKRLDALIVRTVSDVRKAVKWNSPFYGVGGDDEAGRGWFLSFHCFAKYIKVAFFRGTSLHPVPPGKSKHKEVRYLDIYEDDPFDEEQFAAWVKQASQLPGERM